MVGTLDIRTIFLQRQRFDIHERASLEDHGGIRTTAAVTGVRLLAEFIEKPGNGAELDFTHPPQEHEVHAHVRAQDGSTFAAVFPLFLDEIGDPPAVGEVIHVVFDPTNRARVRTVVSWRGPPGRHGGPRWRVPQACPRCGAPVDQATESFAARPMCRMCSQPLPCEPAT